MKENELDSQTDEVDPQVRCICETIRFSSAVVKIFTLQLLPSASTCHVTVLARAFDVRWPIYY
jgi:hypothetical protein